MSAYSQLRVNLPAATETLISEAVATVEIPNAIKVGRYVRGRRDLGSIKL